MPCRQTAAKVFPRLIVDFPSKTSPSFARWEPDEPMNPPLSPFGWIAANPLFARALALSQLFGKASVCLGDRSTVKSSILFGFPDLSLSRATAQGNGRNHG